MKVGELAKRQLERYTMNDRKIQSRVYQFHQGENLPQARYLVAPA